jgi:tetratricopeptide (TPR) repeat protein
MTHQNEVEVLAMSPDGKTIVTLSFDTPGFDSGGGIVRLWSAADGTPIGQPMTYRSLGFAQAVVALSPDGKTIVTGGDDEARLWSTADGTPIGPPMTHQRKVDAVAFSPDGKTIVTGSGAIARLWSTADCTPIGQPMSHQDAVRAVAFNPAGKTIATVGRDGTARLWSAADGTPIGQPMTHQYRINAVAFSPDGMTVLTRSENGTARLWSAADGTPIGPPMTQTFGGQAAFSPDGKTFVAVSADRTARLWSAADGTPIGQPMTHRSTVNALAFSPDGNAVLIGYADGAARLWSAADGTAIGPPMTHRSTVDAVAFSPDGKTVATVTSDGTTRLWWVPSAPVGDARRIGVWVQVITGMELDESNAFRVLDTATWHERHRLLLEWGGPPDSAGEIAPRAADRPAPKGASEAVPPSHQIGDSSRISAVRNQAGAWISDLGSSEVWSSEMTSLSTRGQAHAELGRWELAVADYAELVRLRPDDPWIRNLLADAYVGAGRPDDFRRVCSEMIRRFAESDDFYVTSRVVHACIWRADAVSDPSVLVRLAELASFRNQPFRGLGFALYRAGRFEEAVQRLDESVKASPPRAGDWLFLAMAHHRLGHVDEARRYLELAERWIDGANRPIAVGTQPRWFNWNERMEYASLHGEAKALIQAGRP